MATPYRDDLKMILPLLSAGLDPMTGLNMFMGAQEAQDQRKSAKDAAVGQVIQQVAGMYGQEGIQPEMMNDMAETLMGSHGLKPGGNRWNETLAGLAPVFTGQAGMMPSRIIEDAEDLNAVGADAKGLLDSGTDRHSARQQLQLKYETMARTMGFEYTDEEREAVNRTVDAVFGGPSSYFGDQPAAQEVDPAKAPGSTDEESFWDTNPIASVVNNMLTFGGAEKLWEHENIGDIFEGLGQTALGLGSLVGTAAALPARAAAGGTVAGALSKIPGVSALTGAAGRAVASPVGARMATLTGAGSGIKGMATSPVGGGLIGNWAANAATGGDPGMMGPLAAVGGAAAGTMMSGGLNALKGGQAATAPVKVGPVGPATPAPVTPPAAPTTGAPPVAATPGTANGAGAPYIDQNLAPTGQPVDVLTSTLTNAAGSPPVTGALNAQLPGLGGLSAWPQPGAGGFAGVTDDILPFLKTGPGTTFADPSFWNTLPEATRAALIAQARNRAAMSGFTPGV